MLTPHDFKSNETQFGWREIVSVDSKGLAARGFISVDSVRLSTWFAVPREPTAGARPLYSRIANGAYIANAC